ncbi:MAG: LysR family transcriptional regulator [Pseudomonadota bacterium]
MNEATLDWNDLRLFLVVAREGGLSPAAKLTQRSAATLARRMTALEDVLQSELFVRHDRGYALTPEGERLLENLKDVEPRINGLLARNDSSSTPLVKISAGTWTTLMLIQNIDDIAGKPADVRLRFVSVEAVLNISHREVVIGFRNQRPSEDNLAGRKLAQVHFAPYGMPDAPERWIKVVADTPSARWLDNKIGNSAFCEVNAPRNGLDLALSGTGTVLLPTFVGDAQDGLIQKGDIIPELSHDQWLVTHQDDRHLPHVRRAINRLYQVFSPDN